MLKVPLNLEVLLLASDTRHSRIPDAAALGGNQ